MFSPPTVRDNADGSPVLVKHASGDATHALRREAQLLEQASQLGVVQVRGLLELENRAELTLVYVPGAPLAQQPALTMEVLVDVALQLGNTLAGLHDLGICHGVVTADHVLIDKHGRVVLCGFGRAAATGDPQAPQPNDDIAALAALLADELVRSEDAGLTTLHRREAAELYSSIRFASENTTSAGHIFDLRKWLSNLSEIALSAKVGAGLTRMSKYRSAYPQWWPLKPAVWRALIVGLVVITALVVWQVRSGNGAADGVDRTAGNQTAGNTSGFDTGSSTNLVDGTNGGASSAGAGNGRAGNGGGNGGGSGGADKIAGSPAGGRRADVASSVTEPAGVLLLGTTPERCYTNSAGANVGNDVGATNGTTTANGVGANARSAVVRDAAAGSNASTTASTPNIDGLGSTMTATIADITGNGCVEHVVVGTFAASTSADTSFRAAGQPVIVAGTRRWHIGQPDDHVAVGDWNCDGLTTPAIVRPSSGEAFFFAAWPHTSTVVRPNLIATVPAGPTGVAATVSTDTALTDTVQTTASGVAFQCHDLVVSYGDLSLRLNPHHHSPAALLSPIG